MGFHDACYDFLWECIESCCGFCHDVVFCDLGTPEEILAMMCEYRRIKRIVPTVYYGDFSTMSMIASGCRGWSFFLFPDEIVHQSSWHYLWDVSVRHIDDYEGAFVPILNADGIIDESPRIFSGRLASRLRHDGVELFTKGKINMLPAGLFPRPVWKVPTKMSYGRALAVDPPSVLVNSPAPWAMKQFVNDKNGD